MFYIYQYIDVNTQQPFYIGKGIGRRLKAHLNEAKSRIAAPKIGRPSYCVAKIMKLLKNDTAPIIEIVSGDLSEDAAYELEKTLIAQYGRKGIDKNGILTNRALGGLGGSEGFKMPQSVIDALILRNYASKGKKKPGMSAYCRENPHLHISSRQRGVKQSEHRKDANAKTQREKEISVKIMTFQSPTGKIFRVKEWQAFLRQNNLSYNLIRHAGKEIKKGPNAGWKLLMRERFYNPPQSPT